MRMSSDEATLATMCEDFSDEMIDGFAMGKLHPK
jgi:hypothetical protein